MTIANRHTAAAQVSCGGRWRMARSGLIPACLAIVASAPARGAVPDDGTTSGVRPRSASGVNQPVTLPPRRAPRSLDDTVVSERVGVRTSWYSSVPVALLVVLGSIVACAYAAKRHLRMGQSGGALPPLQVVARSYLSPKQSICLVRAGPRLIMVGVTADRITHLTDIDDPDAAAQLIGQAEASKEHSRTGAFQRLVVDEGTVYRRPSPAESIEPGRTVDARYGQGRGHLDGLLGKIRSYARNRGTG